MYPNNINCLEIETNDGYSKAVKRIIIITIVITVGLSILGAWDVAQNGYQQEISDLPFVPQNKLSEENSENNLMDATICGSSDVSVPEYGTFEGYDTKPGDMEIAKAVLPDPAEQLPLCITNDFLDDYYMIVGTYGGYTWDHGFIKVIQGKTDAPCTKELLKGCIVIKAEPIVYAEGQHGWQYYNLTFSLKDGAHPICLDSNHIPDSPLGDFFTCGPSNLDKFVDLKVVTIWEGCPLDFQEFMVILAHKAMSQNLIPNSR